MDRFLHKSHLPRHVSAEMQMERWVNTFHHIDNDNDEDVSSHKQIV